MAEASMKTPLIDAEVLADFFEKADSYLTTEYTTQLSWDLAARSQQVQRDFPTWPALWDMAPASHRLERTARELWEPRLESLRPWLQAGDARSAFNDLKDMDDRPRWLVDWITYWCHLTSSETVWWARWVYGVQSETGALLLLLDDPSVLKGSHDLMTTYQSVSGSVRFLKAVLESTRHLASIDSEFRPEVTLAVVYSVYMFTMASWKLTQEFTQVLPPFPMVIRTLLGLNRWEGK